MATPDDLESDDFKELDEGTELDNLDGLDLEDDTSEDIDLDYEEAEDDEEGEGADKAGDSAEDDDDDSEEVDLDDEDPEEEEESLDVILAREQDLEEEFARSEDTPRASPTTTPAGEDEFTCRSCFLVKRRAQLADEDALICLDCA